jgi:hypothetical protein
MNRLIKLVVFTVFAAAFSITALAQDVLPVPETTSTDASPRAGSVTLQSPVVFGAIQPGGSYWWTPIGGGATYTVKFKILLTGQIIKWKPQVSCYIYCVTSGDPGELFAAGHDGYDVSWQVIANVNGETSKSEVRRGILNEVNAPSLLSPNHYEQIWRNEVTGFKWNHPAMVTKFTLIVRDFDSGQTVLKTVIQPTTNCWHSSPYDLCAWTFGGVNPSVQQVLKENRHYVWFVKVVGPTGERAKSGKFHLFTLSDRV